MQLRKTTLQVTFALMLSAVLFASAPASSYAQEQTVAEQSGATVALDLALRRALTTGDHSAVSAFFGQSVELQLPTTSGIFSGRQADMILGQFLSYNNGLSYELDHEEMTDDAILTIGRAEGTDESFRICVLSQQSDNSLQIKQLRIETLK